MDELERLLLKEKPCQALLAILELNPAYVSLVAKEIDSTFAHTLRIISQLEQAGLISTKTSGRMKQIELTEPGKKAAEAIQILRTALDEAAKVKERIKRISELVELAEGRPGDKQLLVGPLMRDLALLKAKADSSEVGFLEYKIRQMIENSRSQPSVFQAERRSHPTQL